MSDSTHSKVGDGATPDKAWRPSDRDAEDAIFEIFTVELKDVLDRFAGAMTDFVEIVETQFQRHPLVPCRVTQFDNPEARKVSNRVGALRGDSIRLLCDTVNSYGTAYPGLNEELKCRRVARPTIPKGTRIPWRSCRQDQILGWLTPNEARLNGILSFKGPKVLEERSAVRSMQLGLCHYVDASGEERVEPCADLAESDRSIALHYPLLVLDVLRDYEMAVADASLEQLRSKSKSVLDWRPERAQKRSLDPDWPALLHTYMTVRHPEQRDNRTNPKSLPLEEENAPPTRGTGSRSKLKPAQKMSKAEANTRAGELLKADKSFADKNAREWASKIGCSVGLVSALPIWKVIQEKKKLASVKTPRAVTLTHALEQNIDARGKTGRAISTTPGEDTLDKLRREQEADFEPSPLDPDPGTKPVRAKRQV